MKMNTVNLKTFIDIFRKKVANFFQQHNENVSLDTWKNIFTWLDTWKKKVSSRSRYFLFSLGWVKKYIICMLKKSEIIFSSRENYVFYVHIQEKTKVYRKKKKF